MNFPRKSILLVVFLSLFAVSPVKSKTVTDTVVLKPNSMVSQPFGLTEMPTLLYAYISYDDSALSIDGPHWDQIVDFESSIGNTSWTMSDITESVFYVESGKVTSFHCYAELNDGRILDTYGNDTIDWLARDKFERPNPEIQGTYSIVKGIVPVSSTFNLLHFISGLISSKVDP